MGIPVADELMVARIVSTDMGLGMPPQPFSSCIRRRPEDLLPLGLAGGGWSVEFNYKRLQDAFIGEEEDGTRTIQGGVLQLSHFVHIWQEQIMIVQNKQPLVLHRLKKSRYIHHFSLFRFSFLLNHFHMDDKVSLNTFVESSLSANIQEICDLSQ